MNTWVTAAVLVLSGVVAVATLVLLVRDRPAGDPTYAGLAVLEVALAVQVVTGLVALGRTDRDVSGVLFVSYLVGLLLVLPIGAFWSLAERTRAGTAVLLLAAATVVGMELRLEAIWGGAGA